MADDWLMEECLGVAICQGEITISKAYTSLVDDVLETAHRVGEKKENLKYRKEMKGLHKGKEREMNF